MVASLQHKKEALEAKLRDKTSELRKLCIEEAELTGVLPAETPLEPGESPPQFRRRVGTSFTYPESLINKLKSKEDEALSALELECKVQTGIAEAALGLANDGTASKSVRRKHRVLYVESQRRLSELEIRLQSLRQTQHKQKKKPRPQTEIENDSVDGESDEIFDHGRSNMYTPTSDHANEKGIYSMKNSYSFSGYPKNDPSFHLYNQRIVQGNVTTPTIDYRHSVMIPDYQHNLLRQYNSSPNEYGVGWWPKGRDTLMYQSSVRRSPLQVNQTLDHSGFESSISPSRFGSLDRSAMSGQTVDLDNRLSATLPRTVSVPPGSSPTVLLPGQTYPENSLMRTQSLGNVDHSKQNPDRKTKEKEWYESSLDSSPSKAMSVKEDSTSIRSSDEVNQLSFHYENLEVSKPNQASISSIHFDTVVPYESPKNHTVVEAGKWQPYREITKPFEMSDFYKYSTKFRKSQSQQLNENQGQQKGIYKPLQPLECQPIIPNNFCEGACLKLAPGMGMPHTDRYPPELLSWYHEKSGTPKPRSSTLV